MNMFVSGWESELYIVEYYFCLLVFLLCLMIVFMVYVLFVGCDLVCCFVDVLIFGVGYKYFVLVVWIVKVYVGLVLSFFFSIFLDNLF